MACKLVTNFEVALIKRLWQCSVLSRTLRVAAPSPPPPPWGRGRVRLHLRYLGIPTIFQLVCDVFHPITSAFSGYSRSAVEARNCHLDRRETGTQIGQIGKTKKTASDIKSKNPLVFFAKTENQMLKRKIYKPQWTPKPKNRSFFGAKTEKPI